MVEIDLYNTSSFRNGIDSCLKDFQLITIQDDDVQANYVQDNYVSYQLPQLVKEFSLELTKFKEAGINRQTSPKVIIAESKPEKFIAGLLSCVINNCPVFLCNPGWGSGEKQQVLDLVEPDIVWGVWESNFDDTNFDYEKHKLSLDEPQNLLFSPHLSPIMIPTGGSSGRIKFAIHNWETLTASVKGFIEYFDRNKINSLCVLPLYHVSGLMQFMRCFVTGGHLIHMSFKQLENADISNLNYINPSELFLSLVPTQLQRLIQKQNYCQWLREFATILIGGAPAWEEILQKARYYHLPLAPTYGMTETASGITILKPDDFLKNKTGCGQVLPHVQVKINNQNNQINIKSKSLFLGYYSNQFLDNLLEKNFYNLDVDSEFFQVGDNGKLDSEGYLYIFGRSSEKIITGGENVYPNEVETAIRSTGLVEDVCVIGVKDKMWGEAVTAIFIPNSENILVVNEFLDSLEKQSEIPSQSTQINNLTTQLKNRLKGQISNYKIPKHWVPVYSIPRNSQGKINRQKLNEIVNKYMRKREN